MAERIELEISTQGMRAGAEEAKQILASIPKAAGQAAKDADAEMKRAAASAKAFTSAMERQASAEAAARQKQATALNNARVAAVAQNATLQKQIAIQKQVLSGTLSLAQGQEQLAKSSIDAKVKNDALSSSLAKSKTEYAANAAAIRAMQAPVAQSASGFSKLASAATMMKGALVGGVVLAAATQLKTMTVNAIEAADAIDDLASQLNISAEALQEMQFAFEQGGSSAEAFSSGFQQLQKNVGDAAAGIGRAKQVFVALGIDAKKFATDLANEPKKALADFADRVAAIQNPAQQTAVVLRTLGDASWVNVLKQGGQAFLDATDAAQKFGVASNETAKAGGELKNEMNELSQTIKSQLMTALVALGPTLLDVGRWLVDVTAKVGGFIDSIFRLSSASKQLRIAELQTEIAATEKALASSTKAMLSQSVASEGAGVSVVALNGDLADQREELALLQSQVVKMNVVSGSSTTATNNQSVAMLNLSKETDKAAKATANEADALNDRRAAVTQDIEIMRQKTALLEQVKAGTLTMAEATAKAAALDKTAQANSAGLTSAYEKQVFALNAAEQAVKEMEEAEKKRLKTLEDEKKALEELKKKQDEYVTSVKASHQEMRSAVTNQQQYLQTLKASVEAGNSYKDSVELAGNELEQTTAFQKEFNDAIDEGFDTAKATELANETKALTKETQGAEKAITDYGEAHERAIENAILTTSELEDQFDSMLHTLLDGGNVIDDMEDFGKEMGIKLIKGIAVGKEGLENDVLIPNFSSVFGEGGIVGQIFGAGGASAGKSFVDGIAGYVADDPTFGIRAPFSGGDAANTEWTTAGSSAGKSYGGGFMAGVGAIVGGTGVGMGIGGMANKALGIGQTKPGQTGSTIGGVGGGVLAGAMVGMVAGPLGMFIGAAIGAIIGMLAGGALGDLFAPGRIAMEKANITKFYEKVFDGLNFKKMSEKAVAKGLIDYDEVRNAGETLGLIFADSMGKGATQGTMIRFPGQLFANFRKMGLSVEEAKEKVLELAKAMGVDFAGSIDKINMAMNKASSGPTLLGLGITQEEIKEARKNLKEYGDTSSMTIAELDALALANGNVGSTIITLNQLYAGAVDLQTGFADHAAAVAGVNGLLADKFKDVATAGGMAEESITDLSEKVRNGTLSVEEALIAYNKWAESAGKTKLALEDVALDADAFAPLTTSIEDANMTLEELITRLQEVDQLLLDLADRQITIKVSLSEDLASIGAISPLEDVTTRKQMAWGNLERSRSAVENRRGEPTDAERLQYANDLRDFRKILLEEYNIRKANIEQVRQERIAAIDTQEKTAIEAIQKRYAGQRADLEKEMEAAKKQGEAEIAAAKAQGDALVEAARKAGQEAIEAARKQGQAEVEAAREQGQAEVEAAREQGQAEVEAARAAGDAIIKAVEDQAEAAMALLEKEKQAQEEASKLREDALNAEIDLLQQWRDLSTALGEQIHALITAAESPLSGSEQFGAIQRETERARQRLEGASGAERIPAMQDLARLLGEQLTASPYQRLDPRQRELFSKLTQELTKLQQEAGREGAPLEDKQAQLLLLQAQSADALKSIDARIEAARTEAELARERAEAQANALVEAAEAAADARNAMADAAAEARNNAAEANAERRNEAAQLHAQALAEAAQKQAEELLEAAEATADARNKELQAKMDALSEAEKQEIALITLRATAERNAVNIAAAEEQRVLLQEQTNLQKDLAKKESEQITELEGQAREDRAIIIGKITEISTNTGTIAENTTGEGETLGRLATAIEGLNTFLSGVTKAQGGMYDPQLKSNRLILAHRGETVAIGQPTRAPQATSGGPAVTIGSIVINGTTSTTKADVKAMVEEAVVQSVRPHGAGRAELRRQGVAFK